jgi:hypothetical protein
MYDLPYESASLLWRLCAVCGRRLLFVDAKDRLGLFDRLLTSTGLLAAKLLVSLSIIAS